MNSHRLSFKRSILWRGDLVRAGLFEAAYSEGRAEVLPLVGSLGFTAEWPIEENDASRTRLEKIAREFGTRNRAAETSTRSDEPPKTPEPMHYWVPTLFRSPPWPVGTDPNEENEAIHSSEHSVDPVLSLPPRLLATWPQLRTRLQPLLTRSVVTRKIDEKQLVQRLCRCESIAKLPRIVRKRSPEHVHVIADRSDRCIPYFEDQQLVSKQIGRDLARDHCRYSVCDQPWLLKNCNATLSTVVPSIRSQDDESAEDASEESVEPIPQSTVLILGDLAVLERHTPEERASWIHCCRRWRQRGVSIYALVPYAIDLWPRELAELVQPIAWQGNAVQYETDARRADLIREIFVRAYPAMRLEPGLLRALRGMVPDALDASLESDVWQHDWLASNHVDGARNDRAEIKERLQVEFERLDDETRRLVLSTQRSFRMSRNFLSLWQLEFLNQTPRTRRLLPEYVQDRAAMRRTLAEYEAYVRRQSIHPEKQDQIVWFSKRASEAALQDRGVGKSVRLLQRTFQESESVHAATRITEIQTDGIARSVTLVGLVNGITTHLGGEEIQDAVAQTRRVVLESTSNVIEVYAPEGSVSRTREQEFWKSGRKPDWVSDYGTDPYGAWCEFQVPRHEGDGMVTQRLRWIAPGEFLMGSPESEEGRDGDESQHLVRLTQGYWLADSPVTQELWMAIDRKENPSEFKGAALPVECVSWKDCQDWLSKLNEARESLQALLPTEAQWEYACRAGTQKAYCFGDDPKELSKYAWWVEPPGNTHAVKQLLPNAWGLYDMHGNVSEWCCDRYRHYTLEVETNPTGPARGANRVYRGGYYWEDAVHCRAAARFNISPDGYGSDIGFRLALSSFGGAEPSEGATRPVAEPGVERVSMGSAPATPRPVRRDRFWKSGTAPDWVSDYGKDTYGLWCEFRVPRHEGDGMVTQRMRWIPPGEFMMGSPETEEGRWDDEGPRHPVKLTQGYWLADTAVTQELWIAINRGENPSKFQGESQPVESVSWDACQDWLGKLRKQHESLQASFPSEAQWEYACRAGSKTAYCFGDDPKELPKYAWLAENSDGRTHPVKALEPNAWGLHDMHGNVWEWCDDWRGRYPSTHQTDPIGPTKGSRRVFRGGCWFSHARYVRSACRYADHPGNRDGYLGFRLLSSAVGAEPSERATMPEAEPGVERTRLGSVEHEYTFLRSFDLDGLSPPALRSEFAELDFGSLRSVRVISDRAGYQFDRITKPAWAVDFGSDEYGLYATFEIKPIERSETKKPRSKRQSAMTAPVRQRLRWIPPGRFVMGSPVGEAGRREGEVQHTVNITHGYWMFDTPCTQALWECVMGLNPSYFVDPERPVEQVNWNDISQFASRLRERLPQDLRFRLPTEAEWEYACRAGSTTATYAGDLEILGDANAPMLDTIAWYGGNSGHEYDLKQSMNPRWLDDRQYPGTQGGTRKVGTKSPNAWGLYDMLGNVWEWCWDWSSDYDLSEQTDPIGPAQGSCRVFRGGSWYGHARFVRSACRDAVLPGFRIDCLGFRLLSSAFEPSQVEGASPSGGAR
jgi:formylglycine-generating enzyme required for sulfatase activity